MDARATRIGAPEGRTTAVFSTSSLALHYSAQLPFTCCRKCAGVGCCIAGRYALNVARYTHVLTQGKQEEMQIEHLYPRGGGQAT